MELAVCSIPNFKYFVVDCFVRFSQTTVTTLRLRQEGGGLDRYFTRKVQVVCANLCEINCATIKDYLIVESINIPLIISGLDGFFVLRAPAKSRVPIRTEIPLAVKISMAIRPNLLRDDL
jgi:hypothetical protein